MTSWPPATTWTTRPHLLRQRAPLAHRVPGAPAAPLAERIGPSGPGRVFPRKVKPLVRLTERETAAYCVLRGIDYIVEECPMAEGNATSATRRRSTPPSRIAGGETGLLLRSLARAAVRFALDADGADGELEPVAGAARRPPVRCAPFRRLVDRAGGMIQPVELSARRRWGPTPAGPDEGQLVSRPFADGDEVLLVDAKKRRYLVTLAIGEFHTHAGVIGHDDVIGAAEGATFRSSHGSPFLAIRPTLADFVLKMPAVPR